MSKFEELSEAIDRSHKGFHELGKLAGKVQKAWNHKPPPDKLDDSNTIGLEEYKALCFKIVHKLAQYSE